MSGAIYPPSKMNKDLSCAVKQNNRKRFLEWLCRPSNPSLLSAIIISGHVSGLITYGATFWVDSTAYVYFGQIFNSIESAKAVFENPQFFLYSHVGWGEPFIWFLMSKLPLSWAWPAMAIGKHLLGAIALLYLFRTINLVYPCRIHVLTAGIISFLPFYQAMHNALLTESVSANCMLVALASSLRIYSNPGKAPYKPSTTASNAFQWLLRYKEWLLFVVASCVSIQFRSILIVFPFAFSAILWVSRVSWRRTLECGVAICLIFLSGFSFASYRYWLTGNFWIPSTWGWSIILGQSLSRSTSDKVIEYAKTLPWPDTELFVNKIKYGKVDRHDLEELLKYWHSVGLTAKEMQRMSNTIRNLQLQEPGIAVPVRRIMSGLSTLGFTVYAWYMPDEFIPKRGQDGRTFVKHGYYYYRYHSWYKPNQEEFNGLSTVYFDHSPAHEHFLATLKPYLKFSPQLLSNPLLLGSVPPDFWFAIGCLSLIFLTYKRKLVAGFLWLAMILNCIAIYLVPIPGIRYCYAFLPVYIVFSSIAMQVYLSGRQYK